MKACQHEQSRGQRYRVERPRPYRPRRGIPRHSPSRVLQLPHDRRHGEDVQLPIRRQLMSTYFATDGNYGTAHGLIVLNTEQFTEADWQAIEEASDNERATTAQAIAERLGA